MRGEHAIQAAIADFFHAALPADVWWTAVDHAHAKDGLTGALRKARGAKPGIPDFLLCVRGRFVGLEVKTATGRLSSAQLATHAGITGAGGAYHVVRSSFEAEALLRDAYGLDLRARHLALEAVPKARRPRGRLNERTLAAAVSAPGEGAGGGG